jgi:hypothetical protein
MVRRDRKRSRKHRGQSQAQVNYYQRFKDFFKAYKEVHPEYAGSFTAFRRFSLERGWAPPVHGAKRPIPATTQERQRRAVEEALGRSPQSFKAIYSGAD